jgi:FLYWCH zinc finger domain
LGGVALVIDGCKYRINRRSGNTVYWRCFYRWCRANAVVEDGKLKSSCGSHICSQPNNIQNGGGGASAKPGRHRQSSDQQTPVTQQTAVHQRPATSSPVQQGRGASASSHTTKMATRAAQGSATHTLTRNANKAKVALRSQKPPTNNNMVIRKKTKANEEDIKPTVTVQPSTTTTTTTNSPLCVPDSPPKQVR